MIRKLAHLSILFQANSAKRRGILGQTPSTTVLLNQARVKQKCSSDWVLPPTLCRHERLFFGARRTTTTLCGLSRQPGASRRARRSRGTTQILLHGSAPSRRAQERRAYGGTAGSRQRAADTPVPPSFGRACSVE